MEAQFEREGLEVEFIEGYNAREQKPMLENPIFIGDYGNLMSLRRVFEDVVKNDHPLALVFEDTVSLDTEFNSKLQAIKLPDRWDLVYLGYLMPIKYVEYSDTLVRGKALGTWAFLVSLEAAKKILAFDPVDHWITLDVHLSLMPLRTFYTKEKLAIRNKSLKTIGGATFLDRNSIRPLTISHFIQWFPVLEVLFFTLVIIFLVRLGIIRL